MRFAQQLFAPLAPWRFTLALIALLTCAQAAGAEYAVLRTGQRLRITGYERMGCSAQAESLCYVLHMPGGRMEVPVGDVLAIEPEEVFGPAAAPMTRTPFDTLIAAAAREHGVNERLITSVIAAESNFNPRAVSPKNARGLMQLMPLTAQRYGVRDVFDPQQNIQAGTRYLRELLDRYQNDLPLALAAYNAGPERVTQHGGVPPFRETRDYIARVTAALAEPDGGTGDR